MTSELAANRAAFALLSDEEKRAHVKALRSVTNKRYQQTHPDKRTGKARSGSKKPGQIDTAQFIPSNTAGEHVIMVSKGSSVGYARITVCRIAPQSNPPHILPQTIVKDFGAQWGFGHIGISVLQGRGKNAYRRAFIEARKLAKALNKGGNPRVIASSAIQEQCGLNADDLGALA